MKNRPFILSFILLVIGSLPLSGEQRFENPFTPEAIAAAAEYSSPLTSSQPQWDDFLKAESLVEFGDPEEAVEYLIAALQKAPHPDLYYLLGVAFESMKPGEEASFCYASAAQSWYVQTGWSWFKAAETLSRDLDLYEGADRQRMKELIESYLLLSADNGQEYNKNMEDLMQDYLDAGGVRISTFFSDFQFIRYPVRFDFPFAQEAVLAAFEDRALPLNEHPCAADYQKALEARQTGNTPEAEKILTELLMRLPHYEFYFELGELYYDKKDFGSAAYAYSSAAESGHTSRGYAWYNAACSLSRENGHPENTAWTEMTRTYLLKALAQGYNHIDYALKDGDLKNQRRHDPDTDSLIREMGQIDPELRFLIGYHYVGPHIAGAGYGKRLYLYADGTYELYRNSEDYEKFVELIQIGERGLWEAQKNSEISYTLTLFHQRVITDSRELLGSGESTNYEVIQGDPWVRQTPDGGSEIIPTINIFGLGRFFRWGVDPDEFEYYKGM
ncbi:MAG: tetratricopeptide repeat protein [Spirochaetales bacterium]|nr:tetratricopeptide repeat protein [Spirochaetales bacterium]